MTALARPSCNYKRQTAPLVREAVPYQQIRNFVAEIKICSCAPDGCLTQRQTGRPAVGRNMTLTLTLTLTLLRLVSG
jgi:hypothetical protein